MSVLLAAIKSQRLTAFTNHMIDVTDIRVGHRHQSKITPSSIHSLWQDLV